MKKLLVLCVIASLTAMANAMILQISVDGNLDPIDSMITVAPSDELILNIHSPDGFAPDGDVYFGLVVAPGTPGVIDNLSGVITAGAPDATMLDPEMAIWPGEGVYGFIGSVTIPQTSKPAGVYIDQVLFHCEGLGDAIVQLWTTVDGETFNMVDQVTIHQIPEPATIALLCLGGLLLRKK